MSESTNNIFNDCHCCCFGFVFVRLFVCLCCWYIALLNWKYALLHYGYIDSLLSKDYVQFESNWSVGTANKGCPNLVIKVYGDMHEPSAARWSQSWTLLWKPVGCIFRMLKDTYKTSGQPRLWCQSVINFYMQRSWALAGAIWNIQSWFKFKYIYSSELHNFQHGLLRRH